MKKNILAATLLSLLTLAGNTHAQNDKEKEAKKNKKVSINIVTEEDGKKTVIDTSFDANDQAAIEHFMRANNIKKPLPPLQPKPPLPPAAPNAPNAPVPPVPPDVDEESNSF